MNRIPVTMEFMTKASPAIIYQFLTTPSCLVRWFCDEVNIQGTTFAFSWEGSVEEAELVEDEENERLVFKWADADEDEYLEFKLVQSALTGETIIQVTDFADEGEEEELQNLWDTQLSDMRREAGA